MLLAHIAFCTPYVITSVYPKVRSLDPNLANAAMDLGATPYQALTKVILPMIRPGIFAGALLAFLYSFDEVALSSLLSTPRFITLPIRIMNYMELTFDPTLAAISTLLILASLVLIVLMEKFVGLDMFVK